jgi:O-antigen/teichoic acid export membrane protein
LGIACAERFGEQRMTGTIRRRASAIGGSALRHAVVPLGSLAVSWWVVRQGSLELWGSVVAPLIIVQLTAHLAQWGQRDLLIRILRAGHMDPQAVWRDNLFTRWPIALPLLVPLFFTDAPALWMVLWALGVQLGGSFDPLIVRDKRFVSALGADAAGLLAQSTLLLLSDPLDVTAITRSFAAHHVVRAVLLWWICGRPMPWPAIFDARAHLRQALPFVLIGLGGLLATRIDVYAVTLLLSEEDVVGSYQVIAALFVQFQLIPGLLARPFGTGLLRMDPSALISAAGRGFRWGLLLLPIQAFVVWMLLTLFFHITPSWSILLAGSLAVLPAFGYVPLFPILYAAHREREVAVLSFMAAGLIAIGSWVLVPTLGLAGGLLASALGQWAQLIGVYVLVQRIPVAAHG